jgi:phosphate:Na+ symporter
MVFQILGGAGLLLYGIEIMKDSLEWISQGRGQKLLEASRKNAFTSLLAGIAVTAINQKSSATTVMVAGMVNAQMISLLGAAAMIMGANIGTTITAQILAFRLEYLAPCIVGIAAVFWKYAKNKRVEYIAEIFIGLGIMFIGMIFMEMGFQAMKYIPAVQGVIESVESVSMPACLVIPLIGLAIVVLIRSSSLLTGIMIAMSARGILPLKPAVLLIVGINLGKCVTGFRTVKGATRTAKRAAVINLLYNLIAASIAIVFFMNYIVYALEVMAPLDLPRQIANAHTLYNLSAVIVCAPFISLLISVSNRIIPYKKEERRMGNLDVRMLDTPGLALAQAYGEIINLAKLSLECYEASFRCIVENGGHHLERIMATEDVILRLQKKIEVYLVKLAQKNITKDQHEILNLMLGASGDIERIADLSINIGELSEFKKENSITFSWDAMKEMSAYHDKIQDALKGVLASMENKDAVMANSILSAGIKIKNIEAELRENHIARLSSGNCNPGSGVMFMDLVNTMEHVAEYTKKIGYFVIEVSKY